MYNGSVCKIWQKWQNCTILYKSNQKINKKVILINVRSKISYHSEAYLMQLRIFHKTTVWVFILLLHESVLGGQFQQKVADTYNNISFFSPDHKTHTFWWTLSNFFLLIRYLRGIVGRKKGFQKHRKKPNVSLLPMQAMSWNSEKYNSKWG